MSNKEYRPTLAQLRTFVTIAENRHFGTAAARLGISQPSLSQALVALENGLGVQLIERSTRRVIVTTAGEELLPYARATLEAAEAFLTRSRGASGRLTGPFSIGIIPTIAPYILPTLLQLIHQKLPELEPYIVEDQTKDLEEQLREGALDAAIMALPSDSPGLVEKELYREEFVVAVPAGHPFAGKQDLQVKDIGELNLLLLDDGHCLRDQIVDLCRIADINAARESSPTRAASLSTVIQCVAGRLGSTLVPLSAVATEGAREGVEFAHFAPGVTAERTVGLVHRSSSARISEFQLLGQLVTQAYNAAIG